MYNNFAKSNVGGWVTTTGASVKLISSDGKTFNETEGTIYGNGRHKAIVQIIVELGDEQGNELSPDKYPDLDSLMSCIHLGNYEDKDGFTLIGTGESQGWSANTEHNCFMSPLVQSGDEPVSIDPTILNIKIEDSVAFVYYLVSYDPDKSGSTNCSLGLKVQIVDKLGIEKGKPFFISSSHPDNGDPINLTALPAITFNPEDFDWNGTHVVHDDEDDYFSPKQPESGNFWREIAYTVQLKDDNEYPGEERYSNRIFRCKMPSNGYYTKDKLSDEGRSANYYFGLIRNGFYAFTGYLWPYNIYNEDEALSAIGEPIVPAPPPDAEPTENNFVMMADGIPATRPHVPYAKHQINFSLFCSFGWTSNNVYNYFPLYLVVYDQYGNMGDLAADPTLIPDQYTDPMAEGGLCEQKFLAVLADQKVAAPPDNARNVYFHVVASDKDSGKEYYLEVREQGESLNALLAETDGVSPPEVTPFNSFRLYRNNGASAASDTHLNSDLTYNFINYEYHESAISPFGNTITTMPVLQIGVTGWRLVPIWSTNNVALYWDTSKRYFSMTTSQTGPILGATANTTNPDALEWSLIPVTALTGAADTGDGYAKDQYRLSDEASGRRTWVRVGQVTMTLGQSGSVEKDNIYPNGFHQAKVTIGFPPLDVDGNGFTPDTAPSIEYVKSVVSAIDYFDLSPLERDTDNPGWSYSFEPNIFTLHRTEMSGIDVDHDSFRYSYDDDNNYLMHFDMYVSCKAKSGGAKKQIGLKFAVWDKRWGDPVITTCSAQPAGAGCANYHASVEVDTCVAITYSPEDLSIIPTNLNSDVDQDDNWPTKSIGLEDPGNMWRLWNYEITLAANQNRMFCATIDNDAYKSLSDQNGGYCFLKSYDALYASEAWLWPTNLLDYDFKAIDKNTTTEFAVGNYGRKIFNEAGKSSVYMSIYMEFGAGIYKNTTHQSNVNMIIYDEYGNSGNFHLDFNCLPEVYNRDQMSEVELLANGHIRANPIDAERDVSYQIVSCWSQGGETKYITVKDWVESKVTYDVSVDYPADYNSRYVFKQQADPSYCRFYTLRNGNFSLGTRYEDPDLGVPYGLFAGVPESNRFDFFFRPVWNCRGFVMSNQLKGLATDMALARIAGGGDNAALKSIIKGDDSFIWSLGANVDLDPSE